MVRLGETPPATLDLVSRGPLARVSSCDTTRAMSTVATDSWVILSPHHDDAALSLGLTLLEAAQRGTSVHVLNAFTVSSHCPGRDAQGVSDVSSLRAEEDATFVAQLPGGVAGDLGRRDASLRGYDGVRCVRRRALDASERAEVLDLALQLRPWQGHDVYFVPLGLGDHIDHRVARVAAERAWAGAEIRYYEDLPYGAWGAEGLDSAIQTLGPSPEAGLSGASRAAEDKASLVACFGSQHSEAQQRQVVDHTAMHGGERWWRRTV
jgi:LmbE family N-acetylglucosaminyl deacetylase